MARLGLALLLLLCPYVCAAAEPRPLDPAKIPQPSIPDRTFNIIDFGAVGDGVTVNTDAVKKAVDACKQAGGGVVLVPQGRFVTGPFQFVSNVNLKIAKGATLLPIADAKHYRVIKDIRRPHDRRRG